MTSRDKFQSINPSNFREVVASVWESRGYETTLRDRNSDNRIDVEAQQEDKKVVIQVKRYSDNNTIGSKQIREYAKLYQQTGADDVVLVTSGYFTDQARELAEDLAVSTINGDELARIIDSENIHDIEQITATNTNQTDPDKGLSNAFAMMIAIGLPVNIVLGLVWGVLHLTLSVPAESFQSIGGLVFFIVFILGYFGLNFEHFSRSYWRTKARWIKKPATWMEDDLSAFPPGEIYTRTYKIIKLLTSIIFLGWLIAISLPVSRGVESIPKNTDYLSFQEGFSRYPLTTLSALGILLFGIISIIILFPLLGYYISKDKQYLLRKFDQNELVTFWLKNSNLSEEQISQWRPLLSNRITRHWLYSMIFGIITLGFYPLFYIYNRKRVIIKLAVNPNGFDTSSGDAVLSSQEVEKFRNQLISSDDDLVAEFRDYLTSADPKKRKQSARLLVFVAAKHPEHVRQFLQELQLGLQDDNQTVRLNAICALGIFAQYYPTDMKPLSEDIRALLEDDNKEIRKTAAKTLKTFEEQGIDSNCLKCNEEISTKATKCPACGYEPKQGYESEAGFSKLIAIFLTLTIVGIVLAIPLWWYAAKCQRKARGMKPTNTVPDRITAPPNI